MTLRANKPVPTWRISGKPGRHRRKDFWVRLPPPAYQTAQVDLKRLLCMIRFIGKGLGALVRLCFFASMFILLVGCSSILEQTSALVYTEMLTEIVSTNPGTEVSISSKYIYYQIMGATADDLRTQMNQFGRTDENGRHWDGYTEWYVTWSYPYSITDEGCTLGRVEVKVDITFVLPQWNPPANVSPRLVEKWKDYLAALELHEEGHKEIAIEAGYEIWRFLNGLSSYSSCDELEQAADAATEEILERYLQREAAYDQETEHGATQGVRFP